MKNLHLLQGIFLWMFLFGELSSAQDVHYSQFYMTSVLLNPATAGTFDRNYRFMTNYRSQWGSISSPFSTISGAFDMWFTKNKSICGGLTFYNDKAGDSKMGITQVNLVVSTVHQLNKQNILSGGIQAGFVNNSINLSGVTWDSQYKNGTYDPAASSNEPGNGSDNFTHPDIGAGIFWMSKPSNTFRVDMGVAAHHLNFPKYSFYDEGREKQDIRIVAQTSVQYFIQQTNITIMPNLLFQNQGASREIVVGSMVRYVLGLSSKYTGAYNASAFYFGAHYRVGDAFIPSIMVDYEKFVTAGVSYDINLSGLTVASKSMGGMEVFMHIPVSQQHQRSSVKLK